FLSFNVKGLKTNDDKYTKATILFGLLKKKGHNSPKSQAMEFALSSSKAYIASCLTKKETIKPSILWSVMISAAADTLPSLSRSPSSPGFMGSCGERYQILSFKIRRIF
ncbi:Uncharacterized protein FKW44_010579, partial [Caligus rogercresseyi]